MMNDKFNTVLVLRVAQKAHEFNVWPSLPVSKAQTVRAILYQMEQTKWRKPEVIHHQFTQLKSLVAQTSEATPFRRNRLDAWHLAPRFDYLKDVWKNLSPLKRCNLQGAEYAIHFDFAPESRRTIFGIHSSGFVRKTVNGAFREQ